MARLVRFGALLIVLAAFLGCKQSLDLKNSIVEAVKSEKPFTLTLTSGTGGSVAQGSVQAYPNKPAAITAIPAAGGYLFDKWTATPAGAAAFADPNSEATTVTVASADVSVSIRANFLSPANRKWVAIASSADGQHLAAAATNTSNGDQIYTSSNSGTTWTLQQASPTQFWHCIASDSTGQYLVAGSTNPNPSGNIYTSADYGRNWTKRSQGLPDSSATSVNWYSIASSSDGMRLVAADNGGTIYTSSDRGASWAAVTSAGSLPPPSEGGPNPRVVGLPDEPWVSVTSDCTGQMLVAAISGGSIFASEDYGAKWYLTYARTSNWTCLASAKGAGTNPQFFRAAVAYLDDVCIATTQTTSDLWSPYTVDSTKNWTAIASDATGKYLVATASEDSIYTFNVDLFSATWARQVPGPGSGLPIGASWQCVASDGSGLKLVAGVNGGHIYCSSNQGMTWTLSL